MEPRVSNVKVIIYQGRRRGEENSILVQGCLVSQGSGGQEEEEAEGAHEMLGEGGAVESGVTGRVFVLDSS